MTAESFRLPLSADRLDQAKFEDEAKRVARLLANQPLDAGERRAAAQRARDIVNKARAETRRTGVIETFLEEFGLSNPEGLALMCLAEALLRVPDSETADALIAEKIASGDWADHRGRSDSLLVNASTWGLMLTGRIVSPPADAEKDPAGFIARMVRDAGEPVIRAAVMQAMRIMGEQFVLGRTIREALKRGQRQIKRGEAGSHSFDMLGEGARTMADAQRYFESYAAAIAAVGEAKGGSRPEDSAGISVKLSALHPAYRAVQAARVHRELYPMVLKLAEQAAKADINFTLDAEEADRLTLSLDLLARLSAEPSLKGWTGLGLALQAYQKRAEDAVAWLGELTQATGRRLMVRLVKGAYWDSEIKRGQVDGQPDYPVFTTKAATDVSYIACARALLAVGPSIYAQFATHNAHTLAAVEALAQKAGREDYEFQRLHGMGGALYAAAERERRVRIYAPVGAHQDLLPYLVRRLLENGANTSFVHSFLDDDVPAERIAADPVTTLTAAPGRHPRIPTPPMLYGGLRRNSRGLDLSQADVRARVEKAVVTLDAAGPLKAEPTTKTSEKRDGADVRSPGDGERIVGVVASATQADVDAAYVAASAFQPAWNARGGHARGAVLRAMGDALEDNMDRLVALMAREGGKTLDDGVADVREAVDFCRYYATEAEVKFAAPERLPGPAGETNALELMGRGVFVCISPWNFPLAIFTGQLAGALAAGNTVLAKPAEQTPLVAAEAVRLWRDAGLPTDALHLLTGDGKVGAWLTNDPRCAGVAFTGSTEVGRIINRALAAKDGPIAPLIAETGGLNAMFVDTTALKEQVADDVVASAFRSAGQRCSALRILFLPHETADDIVELLKGAMDVLRMGDPGLASTDIGPVIDGEAYGELARHLTALRNQGFAVHQVDVGALAQKGHYFGPALVELPSLKLIEKEVFGPILHVIRYDPDDIENVGAELSAKGYGLTLGVHTRLDGFAEAVKAAVRAGNVYVNRTIIGAVVGVQPFGGMGLSGTGPKAGGPHYVARFATERTVTVNIAAQGGDPALLNL